MADKTVNEGLLDTVKELKETNKRMAKASDALAMNSQVGKNIGDVAQKFTAGFEQLPGVQTLGSVGKTLFNKFN